MLERTLCDADAALHLTLHAMSLATKIYECGTPDAADRALTIAEQALAATLQQLARAQTLVAHKVLLQQQGLVAEEEDADLQDTCSSSYSVSTTSTELVGRGTHAKRTPGSCQRRYASVGLSLPALLPLLPKLRLSHSWGLLLWPCTAPILLHWFRLRTALGKPVKTLSFRMRVLRMPRMVNPYGCGPFACL